MSLQTTASDRSATAEVAIPPLGLAGTLTVPQHPIGLVVFAHGSGSSRLSPRNNAVARALNEHRFATVLFDLLTAEEESDRANVFHISLLAQRLVEAVQWLGGTDQPIAELPIGLFGASTGAAAALVAAARLPQRISAVVSRGGRPDLAGDALPMVHAPTLLIVGGADLEVIELNEKALNYLRAPKALEIVKGATHLFPEPGCNGRGDQACRAMVRTSSWRTRPFLP
jgi:putative phosphoribosyl transferase